MNLVSLNSISYAQTDLNSKFLYCEKERDQAEKTLDLCTVSLKDCNVVRILLKTETITQKQIIDEQAKNIVAQLSEIRDLKEESHILEKILYVGAGIGIGILLHIPISLFIK